MTKNQLFTILTLGSVAATMSCDDGSASSSSGLSTDDCPIGMFRPVGLDQCVFSADDENGNPLNFPDDRCAPGQPVVPPTCASAQGLRAYLADTTKCAPNYTYEPGTCERVDNGAAGQGTAGQGTAGVFGGFAGSEEMAGAAGGLFGGFAGDEDTAGSFGAAGASGPIGTAGAGGAATESTDGGSTDALSIE